MGCAVRRCGELNAHIRLLDSLVGNLTRMERELCDRETPMPDLLRQLARAERGASAPFFAACLRGLEKEQPLALVWEESLKSNCTLLNSAEQQELARLGIVLGRYSGQEQARYVAAARESLWQSLTRARQERQGQMRLNYLLAGCAGLLLVILLF